MSPDVNEHIPAEDNPPPVEERRRRWNETKTRSGLVWALLLGYFALIGASIYFAAQASEPDVVVDRILSTAFPTLAGFLGTALGFYFGDKRN